METNQVIEQEQAVLDAQESNPLVRLVAKLDTQKQAKYDIVLPADQIRYVAGEIEIPGTDTLFKVSELCDDQMAEKLDIPRAYYRKMRSEYPELLDTNVNSWLSKKTKTKYLLRTFKYPGTDSICRAMLSNSYNIIDNYDVLIAALEAIDAMGVKVEITKAQVTDKRMYLHVTCPEIQIQADKLLRDYKGREQIGVGNGIVSGICIANSELGVGSYEVSARAVIVKCCNGLLDRDAKFRKVHLGARMDSGIIQWNEEVRQKNYQLVIAQTKQSIQTYLSQDYLGKMVKKLEEANGHQVEHPVSLLERVGTELAIPEDHRAAILNKFIRGGQSSAFGMLNAITRHAQDVDTDTQFDWEAKAFQLLPQYSKWDKPSSKN